MSFFSEMATKPPGLIALKFCISHEASLAQLLAKKKIPSQVRSQSYDVIRVIRTASYRFFKKIVFSATYLDAIDRNVNIMHGLGQQMTTSDLSHWILIFQRSSEVTDIG